MVYIYNAASSADIFNIKILVLSSIGPVVTTVISPTKSIPMARIQLVDRELKMLGLHHPSECYNPNGQ